MHLLINFRSVLLLGFFFFFTAVLPGQSTGFHLQLEQGISAINDFKRSRDRGSFGGYAAALGGEYRFASGFYLKADVQRLSAQLDFNNLERLLNTPDSLSMGISQAFGSTRSKEYRLTYGAGVATNWRKVRFALDLAHSIEFHQRAATIGERSGGLIEDGGQVARSRYNEPFPFNNETWQLVNNSNHQLQLTGSILVELSPRVGLGLFYRTDLLTRWVELQLQDVPGQTDFVTVQRREARQAMTGGRISYAIGQR